MKVALAHDFLLKLGGAERVLKVFLEMFPDAPIYTLLYDKNAIKSVFDEKRIISSSLQNLPGFIRKKHRLFIKKYPSLIESFDFSDFDLVLSSSGAYMHGLITNTDTKHLCYCHSPMRYAWDWKDEYQKENKIKGFKKVLYSYLVKYLRTWDKISADRPDKYLANSKNVQNRIKKYYGIESSIVYPPVSIDRFEAQKKHEDYYLIVSTISPYKKIDVAVRFFSRVNKRLLVIGEGSHLNYLKSIAGDSVEFLGRKSDEEVAEYMKNCRAFIFPGEEDFGITPIEAMACGKPVLALGKGGLKETVIAGFNGEFFYDSKGSDMEDAFARLIYNEKFYDPKKIREHSKKFSENVFKKNIRSEIKNIMENKA